MTGRLALTALAGAIATILLVGGFMARDVARIGIGLAGIGLAATMYMAGKSPPTKGE